MLPNWSLKLIIWLLKLYSLVCFLANLKIVTNIEEMRRAMEPVGVRVCGEIKQEVIYKFSAVLIPLQWLANSLSGISKARAGPEGEPRSLN